MTELERIVHEPVNLGGGWVSFNFEAAFGRPTKILNDAAMQASPSTSSSAWETRSGSTSCRRTSGSAITRTPFSAVSGSGFRRSGRARARSQRSERISTSSPRAPMTSETIAAGNSPCSTTPTVVANRSASSRSRGSRLCSRRSRLRRGSTERCAGAPRRAVAASRRGRTRGARAAQAERQLLDELVRRDDDDEPLGCRGDGLLARVGGAASLHEPAEGADLSAPSIARSSRGIASTPANDSTLSPSSRAAVSVATEVATQRRSSSRAARAGRRKATVEPVPSPPACRPPRAKQPPPRRCASPCRRPSIADPISASSGTCGPSRDGSSRGYGSAHKAMRNAAPPSSPAGLRSALTAGFRLRREAPGIWGTQRIARAMRGPSIRGATVWRGRGRAPPPRMRTGQPEIRTGFLVGSASLAGSGAGLRTGTRPIPRRRTSSSWGTIRKRPTLGSEVVPPGLLGASRLPDDDPVDGCHPAEEFPRRARARLLGSVAVDDRTLFVVAELRASALATTASSSPAPSRRDRARRRPHRCRRTCSSGTRCRSRRSVQRAEEVLSNGEVSDTCHRI